MIFYYFINKTKSLTSPKPITTLLHSLTMPAKYVTNANGMRVLSEDYHPPSPRSTESHSQPTSAITKPSSMRSTRKKIMTPQQQQAALKKAALEREQARSKPGYNSLKK